MKKFILITIALLSLSLLTYKFYNEDSIEEVPTKNIKQSSMLSMMLETEENSGQYEVTTSSSWPTDDYVFNSELSKCENGGTLSWDDTNKKVMFEGNNVDKCYVYFDVYSPPTVVSDVCSGGETLSSCVITLSEKSTSLYTKIFHHDGTLENGINDGSYRYAGASEEVYNFVCFGSSETTCPTDNLYRIIGVLDGKVKLIKYDYANSNLLGTDGDYYSTDIPNSSYKGNLTTIDEYYWNYKATNSASNTWSTSLLNKTNLNTNFISNVGSTWSSKIATTTWKVGGNTYTNIINVIPSIAYQNEIVNPDSSNTTDNATEYSAKVGLMYVSDYAYAASPSAWMTTLYNYKGNDESGKLIRNENWIYMGLYEWSISRRSERSGFVFQASSTGEVVDGAAGADANVRPSFSLLSSVNYVSGSGTIDDPILVN